MTDVSKNHDPSMDDILACVSRIIQQERDGSAASAETHLPRSNEPEMLATVATAAAPIAAGRDLALPFNDDHFASYSDPQSGGNEAEPADGADEPFAPPVAEAAASDALDEQVRAVMIRAATAVIDPWIGKAMPKEIETAVAAAMKAGLEPAVGREAAAAEQRLATRIDARANTAEERLAALVPEAVIAQVAQHIGPAVSRQVAETEERLAALVADAVAAQVAHDIVPAVKKEVAAVEESFSTLVPDAVAAQVAHDLEAALGPRMAAAEARVAEQMTIRLTEALGASVGREIAALEQRLLSAVTQQIKGDIRALFARLAAA